MRSEQKVIVSSFNIDLNFTFSDGRTAVDSQPSGGRQRSYVVLIRQNRSRMSDNKVGGLVSDRQLKI